MKAPIQTQQRSQQMKQQKNMAVDYTNLDTAIAALTTEVTADETIEGSATALINGFAAASAAAVATAVAAAQAASDATNQSVADAAANAIEATRVRFAAAAGPLGVAVAANTVA